MKRAVYAGSFDPLTNGHDWVIRRSAELFDEVITAIGINPEKRVLFSTEERVRMLKEATADLSNVSVAWFDNQYLIKYAVSIGCKFIVRGIRNVDDYEYERAMRNINGDLSSDVTTIFLVPPREIAEISSSIVKGLVGPEDWQSIVAKYVSPYVLKCLEEKQRGKE